MPKPSSCCFNAYLAAIAIEHNACLHSTDNDFRRFPELKHHNPLADSLLQDTTGKY